MTLKQDQSFRCMKLWSREEEIREMDIWEIVLALLTSVGGIGVVIVAAVKLSSHIIAKRLEEKYTLKMNKELEKYKSELGNKTYISKTKFEAEFLTYKELSIAFFDMVLAIGGMIPSGLAIVPADPKKRKEFEEEMYNKAVDNTLKAQNVLNKNVLFISREVYEKYSEILELARLQIEVFQERWNISNIAPAGEKAELKSEDYARTGEINEKYKSLSNIVREYLSRLDVVE